MQKNFMDPAWKTGTSIGHIAIPDCESGRRENVVLFSVLEYTTCCGVSFRFPFGTEVLGLLVGNNFQLSYSLEIALRWRGLTQSSSRPSSEAAHFHDWSVWVVKAWPTWHKSGWLWGLFQLQCFLWDGWGLCGEFIPVPLHSSTSSTPMHRCTNRPAILHLRVYFGGNSILHRKIEGKAICMVWLLIIKYLFYSSPFPIYRTHTLGNNPICYLVIPSTLSVSGDTLASPAGPALFFWTSNQ